jgi:hypothetical protein
MYIPATHNMLRGQNLEFFILKVARIGTNMR